MYIKLTGTGNAPQIPVYGCHCTSCARARVDENYRRRPASAEIHTSIGQFLLDAGRTDLADWVDPGTFTMGSPTSEPDRGTDETEHMVTLSSGFYLGKYEVTQEQYEAVMAGNTDGINATPSQWTGSPNLPVEYVSWNKIQTFLNRLNNSEQAAGGLPGGWEYVLPTEAEWEYACRAGTTTAYSWGAESNASRSERAPV